MATAHTLRFTEEEIAQWKAQAEFEALVRKHGEAEPRYADLSAYSRLYSVNDLGRRPMAEWLVRDVVEERGLTVFFGPDKVGKTAVLSSLLWAYAAGHSQWHGFEMMNPRDTMNGPDVVSDRRVLYVLLEGQSSYYWRYREWCKRYNGGEAVRSESFLVVDDGVSLFEPGMRWDRQETWTTSAKKLWNVVADYRPDILVLDTLSRATAGMDENSSAMAQVVGILDHLRDAFDLATVIVHHTALGDVERPRGHSSLKGAASSYVRIHQTQAGYLSLKTGPHRNSDRAVELPIEFVKSGASFYIDRREVNEGKRAGVEASHEARRTGNTKEQLIWLAATEPLSRDWVLDEFYGNYSSRKHAKRDLLRAVQHSDRLDWDENLCVVRSGS